MLSHRFRFALPPVAMALTLLLAVYTGLATSPPLPVKRPPFADAHKAIAVYRAKLLAYQHARQRHEKKAAAYWSLVNEKRLARREKRARGQAIALADYVLDQPPAYAGPARPVPPPHLRQPQTVTPAPEREPVPVVADFLKHAATHFKFIPDRPAAEIEYKRAYAQLALAAGIGKNQAVRIYAFEAGGNGKYDVQAGLEHPGPKARAITTALGYNQLLSTNTVGLLAEHGEEFTETLRQMAEAASGERRQRLQEKIAVLRQMIAFARTVPNQWSEHDKLARTPKGLALHALNLDVDVGPLLQTQKLVDSVAFARKKGFSGNLSAAELEMMNLMGDGSGLDILLLTAEMREKVPTSNFFQRGGYERNPIVSKYNVAAKLLMATAARMEAQAALPGAKELEAAFDAAEAAGAKNSASAGK